MLVKNVELVLDIFGQACAHGLEELARTQHLLLPLGFVNLSGRIAKCGPESTRVGFAKLPNGFMRSSQAELTGGKVPEH